MLRRCFISILILNIFTIVLSKYEENDSKGQSRLVTPKTYAIWKNATVPFYVNPSHFDHEQTLAILSSLSMFAFKTCIKFKPVMARPNPTDEVMVFINPDGSKRCHFDTRGHSVFNPHFVKLGYDCLKSPEIDMMIMRALGFPFEHNRDTRDLYIEVLNENIEPGNVELFTREEILPVELKFLPYDVNSVMHFGNRDYSKNGHRTILFKDPKLQQNRVGLTETDLKKIEIVYGPECTLRDRKEKLELCQSYPGVARRKRQIDKDVLEDTMLLRMKRDVDEETVVTKSLRVNPDITPPPNQTDTITQTLKDLGIDEAVQEIVEQVYKVSAIALKNARAKYCNNTNEETPPTNLTKITDYRANNSDILGIIEVVTDFTKGMIDHALQNLTTFCENSGELHVYQRYSCSFGGRDPRCRDTYRSTKSGPVKARTQHRPIMSFSTGHNGGAKRIIQFERAGNAPEEEEDEPTTKSIRRKREAETTKADVTEEPTTKAPDDTVTVKEDEVKTTKKEKVTDKESQDDVTETAKGKTKTTTEKHAETKTSEADAKEEATKKTTPKAMTVKRKNNDKKEKAIPAKGKVVKTKERTRKDKKTVNKIPKNKDKTSKKEKSDKYKEKATKNSYFPLKRRVNLSERHINKAVKSKLKGNEHVARNSLKKKVNWSDSRTSKAFISKVSKNRGNTLLKSKAHDLRKRKVTTKENKIRPKVKTMVNKKDVLRLSGKIPAQQKNKLRRSRHLSDLSEESAEVLDNLDTIMANKIKRKKQRIQKNSRKSKHRHRGVRQHRKRDKKGNTDHMAIPIDAFEKDEYMNEGIALESEISRQQNSSEEIVKLIKDKIKFNLAPNKNGNERTKEHRNDDYEEKQEYRSLEYEDDRERPTRPSVTSSEEIDRDLPRTVMLSKKNKDFYNERRWPRGELYYMIQVDTTYDLDDMRERLREVGDILEKKTCVKLIELEPGDEERFEDYILIDNSPDYVTGRVGGKQKFGSIELFRGGQHRQHAAMMVMAMLGFYFEVSRHDRDKYIRVHMRHVRPDKLHHFEMIRSDATLPLPYDYASATHPAWQFWRQVGRTGISTVATYKEQDPDGSIMKSLGQNEQLLSDIDIIKINSVYGIRCLTPRANSLPQNDSLEQNISEPLFKQVMLN